MTFATKAGAVLLSATMLAATVGAGAAAELPSSKPKPKPSEAARSCTVGGMTGVILPGGTVCVKLGGYITGGVEVGNTRH